MVFFRCVITMLLAIVLPVVVFFQLWDQYAVTGVASDGVFSGVITMLLVTGVASGGVPQLCDHHAVGYRCCQWCSSAV